jgi:hypothetical protein
LLTAIIAPAHRTIPVVLGAEHAFDGLHQGTVRIAEEAGKAAERLVSLRIEKMEDRTGEQCGPGFYPVVVQSLAVRIDDHVHDVLHVFGFVH